MSYTRNYRETVSKTVSISYPKSENGGSTSVIVDIPVEVNIHVDTKPFDKSVQNCGTNVNILTAAVAATESAEIVSKEKNSRKVAETIVGGFFSYIRSEISQQVAELSQNIDAHLMHLKELMQSCIAKKKQMEGDYIRISGRYAKIFDDLNHELSNRIFELDKPTFVFKKETDNQKSRTVENDLVNTVSIYGLEGSDLESMISVSIAKKRALDTLDKVKMFLWQQKKLNTTIQQSMLNENTTSSFFTPICFIETNNVSNQIDKNVFTTDYLSMLNNKNQKSKLVENFSSNSIAWSKLTPNEQKNISLYFNTELNSKLDSNDQHSARIREMIQRIADFSSINVISLPKN